jgi:hypothetical protein
MSNINTALRSDSLLKFTTASESISVIGHVAFDDDVTSHTGDMTSSALDVTSSDDPKSENVSELTLAEYLTPVAVSRTQSSES